MSIYYKIGKIKNPVTKKVSYFPKAHMMATISTEQMAERIQRNCTVKKSDVLAVLSELAEVLNDELQNSNRVRLNGIGCFKMGIISKSSEKPSEVSTSNNVKGVKVIFQPETKTDSSGVQNKAFVTGSTVEALPETKQYDDEEEGADTSADSGTDTGSDTGSGAGTDAGGDTDTGSTDSGSDSGSGDGGSTDTGSGDDSTDTGSGDGDGEGGSDDGGGSSDGGEEEQP